MHHPTPAVTATVITQTPGPTPTYTVRLRYDGASPPQSIIDALEERGFQANGGRGLRICKPDTDVVEDFARQGSGAFGAWTPVEFEAARADLAAIFEQAGLPLRLSIDPGHGAAR